MWEYKIAKTDLWWIIYRKRYVGKGMILQYLYANESWGPNKVLAKIFYHEDSARSGLIIVRHKDEWKEPD